MFIFFTIIFLLLAISAVFNDHISRRVTASCTENFLKLSKLAIEDDDIDERKYKNSTIGMLIGAGLLLLSALVKLIYIAFAFKHDPILYPTLFMAGMIIISYLWTTIKEKVKSRKTTAQIAEKVARDAVEEVFKEKMAEGKSVLERLELEEAKSKREAEEGIKKLEEAVAALKKRTFLGVVRDILYVLYFGYMFYAAAIM